MTFNTDDCGEFTAIRGTLSGVLKEIVSRSELRRRLEAEGVAMTDEEFIAYADRTGMKI